MNQFKTLLQSSLLCVALTIGTTAAQAAETFSDSQILHVLKTLNDGEIAQAAVAVSQSTNADVRDFATMMTQHHSENNNEIAQLAIRMNVTPQPHAVSNQLKNDSDKNIAALKAASNTAFDRLYLGQQLKAHKEALNLIDKKLLPNVQNKDAKELVQKTRPVVAAHLTRVQELLAK